MERILYFYTPANKFIARSQLCWCALVLRVLGFDTQLEIAQHPANPEGKSHVVQCNGGYGYVFHTRIGTDHSLSRASREFADGFRVEHVPAINYLSAGVFKET